MYRKDVFVPLSMLTVAGMVAGCVGQAPETVKVSPGELSLIDAENLDSFTSKDPSIKTKFDALKKSAKDSLGEKATKHTLLRGVDSNLDIFYWGWAVDSENNVRLVRFEDAEGAVDMDYQVFMKKYSDGQKNVVEYGTSSDGQSWELLVAQINNNGKITYVTANGHGEAVVADGSEENAGGAFKALFSMNPVDIDEVKGQVVAQTTSTPEVRQATATLTREPTSTPTSTTTPESKIIEADPKEVWAGLPILNFTDEQIAELVKVEKTYFQTWLPSEATLATLPTPPELEAQAKEAGVELVPVTYISPFIDKLKNKDGGVLVQWGPKRVFGAYSFEQPGSLHAGDMKGEIFVISGLFEGIKPVNENDYSQGFFVFVRDTEFSDNFGTDSTEGLSVTHVPKGAGLETMLVGKEFQDHQDGVVKIGGYANGVSPKDLADKFEPGRMIFVMRKKDSLGPLDTRQAAHLILPGLK